MFLSAEWPGPETGGPSTANTIRPVLPRAEAQNVHVFESRRALGPAHRRGGRGLQKQFDRFPLGSQLKII